VPGIGPRLALTITAALHAPAVAAGPAGPGAAHTTGEAS